MTKEAVPLKNWIIIGRYHTGLKNAGPWLVSVLTAMFNKRAKFRFHYVKKDLTISVQMGGPFTEQEFERAIKDLFSFYLDVAP